jgi:hypothetical protein
MLRNVDADSKIRWCWPSIVVIALQNSALYSQSVPVKRVKLSLLQALEAHMVVRRRGSHIF